MSDDRAWRERTQERFGISYRQLDYWVRIGHLLPEHEPLGSGTERKWPTAERLVAERMCRLVSAGLKPASAEIVARGGKLPHGVLVTWLDAP